VIRAALSLEVLNLLPRFVISNAQIQLQKRRWRSSRPVMKRGGLLFPSNRSNGPRPFVDAILKNDVGKSDSSLLCGGRVLSFRRPDMKSKTRDWGCDEFLPLALPLTPTMLRPSLFACRQSEIHTKFPERTVTFPPVG
jgi:hypothetical protein